MKKTCSTICSLLMAVLLLAIGSSATVEVRHVTAYTEDLMAPTSVIAFDEGLVVVEPFRDAVRVLTPDGTIYKQVYLGTAASGFVRAEGQQYYYCDGEHRRVMTLDLENEVTQVLPVPDGVMINPVDLVFTSGGLYVLDAGISAVHQLDENGLLVGSVYLMDNEGRPLMYPSSLAIDVRTSDMWVLEQTTSKLYCYDSDGSLLRSAGAFGGNPGQVTRGGEIAIDADGDVFVADRYQGRVVIFDSDGNPAGTVDLANDASAASMPAGLYIDEAGLLYVASTGGGRIDIYYIDPTSKVIPLDAWPVFPEDGAELATGQIAFRSSVRETDVSDRLLGFEFEIVDSSSQPIGVSGLVAPNGTDEYGYAEGTWSPEFSLPLDSLMFWTVRAVSRDTAGAWANLRAFRVMSLPDRFWLSQNYPNPFNPVTRIDLSLDVPSEVHLEVYSLLGAKVATLVSSRLEAGLHSVTWDGRDRAGKPVASGVYFYRLSAGDKVQTRKMVLMK